MTTEYRAGILSVPCKDGMVLVQIVNMNEDGTVRDVETSIKLKPEIARKVAQRMTLSSIHAEEGRGVV